MDLELDMMSNNCMWMMKRDTVIWSGDSNDKLWASCSTTRGPPGLLSNKFILGPDNVPIQLYTCNWLPVITCNWPVIDFVYNVVYNVPI